MSKFVMICHDMSWLSMSPARRIAHFFPPCFTTYIKILISEKFLESCLDHFPVMKLANKSANTPINKFCFRRSPYSFAKLESSHLHKTREDPFTHYWGQEFFIWVFPSNRGYIRSLKVVSYFYFRLWKCLFWSEEKLWKWLFLTLKTGTFGAWNENLRPFLKSGL